MYFDKVKVGDKVWDYVYGDGEVISRAEDAFKVEFHFVGSLAEFYQNYNFNGNQDMETIYEKNQRLFYYDKRPIVVEPIGDDDSVDLLSRIILDRIAQKIGWKDWKSMKRAQISTTNTRCDDIKKEVEDKVLKYYKCHGLILNPGQIEQLEKDPRYVKVTNTEDGVKVEDQEEEPGHGTIDEETLQKLNDTLDEEFAMTGTKITDYRQIPWIQITPTQPRNLTVQLDFPAEVQFDGLTLKIKKLEGKS